MFDNLETGDNSDQVTLSVASGLGGFTTDSTKTAMVSGGIATFSNLVLDTAGAYTLGESATNGLPGPNSTSFLVSSLPADHIGFFALPATIAAGVAINPSVQVAVLDKFGNLISADSSDQITLTVASGPGGFTAGSTTTAKVSGGIASFSNLILDTAGVYTLGESSTGGLSGPNSSSFTITPATPDQLAFTVQPNNSPLGGAISPAVQVEVFDVFGNLETSDNSDQVTLSVASGPGGFATGSTKTATVSGGIATFSNLFLNTAGAYTLGESATNGLTGPNSNSFTVSSLPADHIGFIVHPTIGTAGVVINPSVQVEVLDRLNDLVVGDNSDQITLSVAGGPGGFTAGSTTTVKVSVGIATFSNLILETAGVYTLGEISTGGLTGPNSGSLTITPATANHLAFSVAPSNSMAGGAISPAIQVQVFDLFGNLETADNNDEVTLSVASGPGGFTTGSTKTATVSGGIATFSNLVLDTAGAYTLGETATNGLAGADSSNFKVSASRPIIWPSLCSRLAPRPALSSTPRCKSKYSISSAIWSPATTATGSRSPSPADQVASPAPARQPSRLMPASPSSPTWCSMPLKRTRSLRVPLAD